MISEWLGRITGRCLREAKQNAHDSDRFHRDEIQKMLEAAKSAREGKEADLERIEQAVSIKEMTGVGGDD